MSTKLNSKDRDQMAKPNEYTDNLKSNLTCIFLSVRAKLKKTNFALGHCVVPTSEKIVIFLIPPTPIDVI